MSIGAYAIVLFVIFFAFSIGFNLGLHGVISLDTWHQSNPKEHAALIFQSHDTQSTTAQTTSTISSEHDSSSRSSSSISISKISPDATEVILPPPVPQKIDPLSTDARIYSSLLHDEKSSNLLFQRTSNALRDTRSRYSSNSPGKLESYIAQGGRIPIVLLTYNRHESLDHTLNSLFAVKGVQKSDVLILQDGGMSEIVNVARKHGVEVVQNMEGMHMRGAMHVDGASRIAKHYKFSLSTGTAKKITNNTQSRSHLSCTYLISISEAARRTSSYSYRGRLVVLAGFPRLFQACHPSAREGPDSVHSKRMER